MELTPQQELFCRYYTQNTELFGNGTLAYAEAYDFKLDELSQEKPELGKDPITREMKYGLSEYQLAYNVCSVNASKLLRTTKIQDRVRVLLNELMRNDVIDAQLVKIIMEGEDKDKVAAIKEYNKLKQRIIEKSDITSDGKPILQVSEAIIAKHALTPDPNNSSEVQQ